MSWTSHTEAWPATCPLIAHWVCSTCLSFLSLGSSSPKSQQPMNGMPVGTGIWSDVTAACWGTEAWDWLSFNFWVWSYMCGLTAGDYKVLYGIGIEKKRTDCLLSGHLCLFILGTFSTYSVSHLSHMQHGTDSGCRYIYILPWSHLLLLFTLSAKPPPWPHTFHLLAPGVPGTECYQQCAWWHTHGINNTAFSLCINPTSFAFSSQMPPPLFFLDLHHLVLHSTCTAQDNWKTSLQETSSGLKWLNLPPAQRTPTT